MNERNFNLIWEKGSGHKQDEKRETERLKKKDKRKKKKQGMLQNDRMRRQ